MSSNLLAHWEVYQSVRNKASNAIKVAKLNHLNHEANHLADPNCPPSKWWNIAKNMCGLKRDATQLIPPLLNHAQEIVSDDGEKANLLNHTFINQNTSLDQEAFPIGPTNLQSTFQFKEISASEVQKAINCNQIRHLPDLTISLTRFAEGGWSEYCGTTYY